VNALIIRSAVIALAAVAASAARPAAAQDRPSPAVEFAGGVLEFPDDSMVTEGFAGGAVRFYILPRISIGPEFAYVRGERHSHQMFTGNVTFDLVRPNGPAQPFTPFAVVGGGLFRTRERFPSEIYTSGEGAFTAGGGFRARVDDA
jgi:hypothetical protein